MWAVTTIEIGGCFLFQCKMLKSLPRDSKEASWFVVEGYCGVKPAYQVVYFLGRGEADIPEGWGLRIVIKPVVSS